MRIASGWFAVMALAIFCRRTVLPTRGGATMTPRWPKPTGVNMSTTRVENSVGAVSRTMRRVGKVGVRFSKCTTRAATPGSLPFTVRTLFRLKKRSRSRGVRIGPSITSPMRKAWRRICCWVTKTSSGNARKLFLADRRKPCPSRIVSRHPEAITAPPRARYARIAAKMSSCLRYEPSSSGSAPGIMRSTITGAGQVWMSARWYSGRSGLRRGVSDASSSSLSPTSGRGAFKSGFTDSAPFAPWMGELFAFLP